jgi:hypothetical protein
MFNRLHSADAQHDQSVSKRRTLCGVMLHAFVLAMLGNSSRMVGMAYLSNE